jgi:hypothetical protein
MDLYTVKSQELIVGYESEYKIDNQQSIALSTQLSYFIKQTKLYLTMSRYVCLFGINFYPSVFILSAKNNLIYKN